IEAEDNRVAELREILLGEGKSEQPTTNNQQLTTPLLNESQWRAVQKIVDAPDVAFIHGPPGTGKTTTIVEAIKLTIQVEKQVLVSAPSNAAVDLLVEK